MAIRLTNIRAKLASTDRPFSDDVKEALLNSLLKEGATSALWSAARMQALRDKKGLQETIVTLQAYKSTIAPTQKVAIANAAQHGDNNSRGRGRGRGGRGRGRGRAEVEVEAVEVALVVLVLEVEIEAYNLLEYEGHKERHARPYIPTPVSLKSIKSSLLRCNGFIKRVSQSRELKRANSTVGNDRYEVCQLLADKGIPCAIWLEDLLALHGSNTQVWDLHLLVEDPRAAAKVLRYSGYEETTSDAKFEDDPDISERTTVLLNCNLQQRFLDSMIEFWLNISSQDYVDRLGFALYIGCLICYCYDLQTSDDGPVKNPAYAEKLKPEHREVHDNITAADPKEESFTTTNRHTYHARMSREIKEGIFVPRPYEKGAFRAPLTTVSEQ
ncbi:hypothetical protein LAWI1_G005618 [Lachnellula willkommii]|uniref:Uncharacterized protein n=1 Tax=Lachnellula willkommii TaxID=215461 RepID=A0A559M892_9HELO|nr:hypothetical protein LAWI1_G005618 [Lachnellula willkommii]